MVNLQDFLGDLNKNYKKDMDKSASGPSGAFDGPPLPPELEYRVTVDSADYKASKAGNWQLVVTYEVQEPSEHAGRKIQEYYATQPGNEIAQRKVSQVLGALGPDLAGVGSDWEVLTQRLVGLSGVIAVRIWGENNDRTGVRWINADRGQALRTNVPPPKAQAGPKNALRPDVSVPKPAAAVVPAPAAEEAPEAAVEAYEEAPAESAPIPTPAVPPTTLPGATRPTGGPNLPPGLR
jgi:hypothetical protein